MFPNKMHRIMQMLGDLEHIGVAIVVVQPVGMEYNFDAIRLLLVKRPL
jgi:hypothetical protein